MTINGIEINESTDIKEILMVFHSLLIQAEGIKEELVTNFSTYESIDIHSVDTLQKYKEVLKSITAIQMNTQKAFEKVHTLDANLMERVTHLQKKIQDENQAIFSKIKQTLLQLEPFTQEVINTAVSRVHVDTSGIETVIAKRLEKLDLKDINQTIIFIDERSTILKTIETKFQNTTEALSSTHEILEGHTQKLKSTVDDVNQAVESFKGINRSVSMGVGLSLLLGGLVLGFGIATFFKIEAISGYYFSSYDKKQKQIQNTQELLEEKLSELTELPNFLLKHHIDIYYGIYSDDEKKTPFLRFKASQVYPDNSSYTFERKGEKFIGFKE